MSLLYTSAIVSSLVSNAIATQARATQAIRGYYGYTTGPRF